MTNNKTEKYQWAKYIKTLNSKELKELIEGLEFGIKMNVGFKTRNEGYLKFAKECLNRGK